jgi:hypothetical protein
MLDPGRHVLWDWDNRLRAEIVTAQGNFASPWAAIVEKLHPEMAAEYFEIVRPAEGQAAVVWLDGRAALIVRPGQAVHIWKVLNDVRVETFDVLDRPRLDKAQLVAFEKADTVGAGSGAAIATVAVAEAQAGSSSSTASWSRR